LKKHENVEKILWEEYLLISFPHTEQMWKTIQKLWKTGGKFVKKDFPHMDEL